MAHQKSLVHFFFLNHSILLFVFVVVVWFIDDFRFENFYIEKCYYSYKEDKNDLQFESLVHRRSTTESNQFRV